VLDANANTGLLTWEALRRAPEGGVWSLTRDARSAEAVRQQAARLPELQRPRLLVGSLSELPALLKACGDEAVRFDAVVGRSVLSGQLDKAAACAVLRGCLRDTGRLCLAEVVPCRAQRPSELVDPSPLGEDLAARLHEAEDAAYCADDDPLVNWDAADLEAIVRAAGFELRAPLGAETQEEERRITDDTLARWFGSRPAAATGRPSYAQHLLKCLNADEVARVEACYRQQLRDQIVPWRTAWVYVTATPAPLTLT